MIEAVGLTKRYGSTVAVDELTFTVPAGQITGFLGPNGAGKSTTMRLILGLDTPTAGTVTVAGRPYRSLRRPLLTVGALLDARAVHGGRSARDHLLAVALSNGIARSRVRDVLDLVGLQRVAGKRAGGFSLGMSQRLGIAAALLGDPPILMFDEPVNGLDPDGVLWIRTLLRTLAAEGRTVLLSSHLMSEMAQTADRLLIIGRGRLIAHGTLTEVLSGGSAANVRVRSSDPVQLTELLDRRGADVCPSRTGRCRSRAPAPRTSARSPAHTTSRSKSSSPNKRPWRSATWNSPARRSSTEATVRRPDGCHDRARDPGARPAGPLAPTFRRRALLRSEQAPLGPIHRIRAAGRGDRVQHRTGRRCWRSSSPAHSTRTTRRPSTRPVSASVGCTSPRSPADCSACSRSAANTPPA